MTPGIASGPGPTPRRLLPRRVVALALATAALALVVATTWLLRPAPDLPVTTGDGASTSTHDRADHHDHGAVPRRRGDGRR